LYSLSLSNDDKLLALGSEDYLVLWYVLFEGLMIGTYNDIVIGT